MRQNMLLFIYDAGLLYFVCMYCMMYVCVILNEQIFSNQIIYKNLLTQYINLIIPTILLFIFRQSV